MRARAVVMGALAALLLAAPFMPLVARAEPSGDGTESRVGVILAVLCGMSLRAAVVQPVPWAGVALLSCAGFVIDAATEPDTTNGGGGKP